MRYGFITKDFTRERLIHYMGELSFVGHFHYVPSGLCLFLIPFAEQEIKNILNNILASKSSPIFNQIVLISLVNRMVARRDLENYNID